MPKSTPPSLHNGIYLSPDMIGGQSTDANFRKLANDRQQIVGGEQGYLWNTVTVPAGAMHIGANPPTWGAWAGTLLLPLFDPDAEQQLYFTAMMPHDLVEGGDVFVRVHWVPKINGGAGHRAAWGMAIRGFAPGYLPGIELTFSENVNSVPDEDYTANGHFYNELGGNTGWGTGISNAIVGRVFRDATAGVDTYLGDAGLLGVSFVYKSNSLGSTTRTEK